MSFKNTFIRHDRSPEVTAWIEEERVEQEERFATIVKQMEELDPEAREVVPGVLRPPDHARLQPGR